MDFSKSDQYWKRAQRLIPSGTQTFSKMPNQFALGLAPKFIDHGEGAYLWDVDGNRFLDYVGALGPIILGYNHPAVNEAIKKQLEKGIIFSLGNPLEIELAQLLVELIPSAEMVKYGKNGNDVTTAAVRVARAFTGRDKIAMCGYHGWQDWHIVTTARNSGIPKELKKFSLVFEYNNIFSLEKLFEENKGEIAAVIMEPVGVVEPVDNFLHQVQHLTKRNDALLIFDEVKTGFRCHIGGAQSLYGVTPDLSCFGKAMANGMPLSALVGKKEILKACEDIFFSMQASGELLSLAASLATIQELQKTDVLAKVHENGSLLKKGCRDLIRESGLLETVDILGLPHYTVFDFKSGPRATSAEIKTLFIQECLKRNILTAGYSILSLSHTQEIIESTLVNYKQVFQIIVIALESKKFATYLECPVVQDVFRNP